ncbi:lytic transglycosylase domain-containing protein [Streptomyces sp. NEAU-Y11]|uniref:lytic transglycosylase domain-containing protein n=1 Tax=Streptomyces cucumeris TaxID=2962890 RepID=UPI0035AC0BF3
MRRAGGVFVGVFLCVGGIQAMTGFIPTAPSVAGAAQSGKSGGSEGLKFTGTSAPVRSESVPVKRYESLINKWGNKCETLTPALLASQLYQESGFRADRNTVSSANAKGFAQFLPSTWAVHGVDGNGDGRRDIWDPEDAIPSAAVYDCKLAAYTRDVPGDRVSNMLASYNAGSNKVKKYQGIPPYDETQNYVRIIKRVAGERFER